MHLAGGQQLPVRSCGCVWLVSRLRQVACLLELLSLIMMVWLPMQCNHRSWADFFVDVLTTQGDSQMLSRCDIVSYCS